MPAPRPINAVQFKGVDALGTPQFAPEGHPGWLRDALSLPPTEPGSIVRRGNALGIVRHEGETRVDPGDWIVHGHSNELTVHDGDAFAATYEAV